MSVNLKLIIWLSIFSNLLFCYDCFSQVDRVYTVFTNTKEKIYLHSDRAFYNSGDDIWFKAYLVDAATLRPEALSKVAYVDLINPFGEILITKTINVKDGCGNGNFKLPVSLTGGEYTLRAYTTYMRNFDKAFFFRKKININPVMQNLAESQDSTHTTLPDQKTDTIFSQKPDVQFFPEGGYLVCGFPCEIGMKATGPDGKGIDISGFIFDSSGKKISEYSTLKFGLGEVQLVPLQGETYKARLSWNNTEYEYEPPIALTNGTVMQVIEQEDFYHVNVRSSLPDIIKNFSFVCTQKSSVLFDAKIGSDDEEIIIKVPKDIFEEGIAQFTLFDEDDNPCCERLVFVETGYIDSEVNLTISKKEYGKKELVELDVSTDIFGLLETEAAMSVAVAPVSAMTDNYETDIKSYLLLNSELRGEIEHPGYYFYSDDPLRRKVLDLLMMTQGWRRYIWDEPRITDSTAHVYQPESGLRFEGKITRYGNHDKSAKEVVSLTCNNNDEFSQYETDADENGHFKFDGIVFDDRASVIIQAKKNNKDEKNSGMNYYIEMDELPPPKEPAEYLATKNSFSKTSTSDYPKSSLTMKEIDSLYNIEKGNILLEEVLVTGEKPDRVAEKRTMYREPDYFVNISESYSQFNFLNVLQILNNKFPGLEISGTNVRSISKHEIEESIRRKKDKGPDTNNTDYTDTETPKQTKKYAYLLDGIPADKETILSIPVSEIHFVDFLRGGAKTAVFGAAGAIGVIAVYTLDAEDRLNFKEQRERKGIINFTHPGFSKAKEFYTPVYSSKESKLKPDYRTTLYWNPTLKLNELGEAKISFYTSDVPSVYKIILEGISPDGEIINSNAFFEVKEY